MDEVKITVRLEVKNIKDVIKQVEELEERLSKLKVNLVFDESDTSDSANCDIGGQEDEHE